MVFSPSSFLHILRDIDQLILHNRYFLMLWAAKNTNYTHTLKLGRAYWVRVAACRLFWLYRKRYQRTSYCPSQLAVACSLIAFSVHICAWQARSSNHYFDSSIAVYYSAFSWILVETCAATTPIRSTQLPSWSKKWVGQVRRYRDGL